MEPFLMAIDLSQIPAQARVSVAIVMVTAASLAGIAQHEDFVDKARIPMKGDRPTYGYGSTRGVKVGDTITPARALMRLNEEVQGIYADRLKRCIRVPVHYYEFGALVMLAYNVGAEAVCRGADKNRKDKFGNPDPEPDYLIDLLNAGKYAEACERINAYVHGPSPGKDAKGNKIKGPILRGLVKRRAYESAMCRGEL